MLRLYGPLAIEVFRLTKFFASFFLLFSALGFAEEAQSVPKKTLLVLSSTGGGGHMAACATLQSLVGNEYELKIIYPINQLGIWGIPSCEKVYNSMLRNGYIRSMNFIVRNMAPSIFRSYMRKVEKIISSSIKQYQPDLMVSVIPFINFPASEAARKAEIPLLVITTDNDLRNWSLAIERLKHPHIRVTIGADLPTTRDVLVKKKISDNAIETIGLPLRLDFLAAKDRDKIRKEHHLPDHKKTVMIMMGGAGGNNALKYAEKIGSMELGVHLIVIAGRNEKLKRELESLREDFDPSNSMTVFGFTDRVSDLMAVSDVLITKPGPGTINEAIAMKLPMLIDDTEISLFWERANVDYVLKYQVGQKIRKFHQMDALLEAYLNDEELIQKTKKSFDAVPANQFHVRVKDIIRELMSIPPGWMPKSQVVFLDSEEEDEFAK